MEFSLSRQNDPASAAAPKDAATLIVARDVPGGGIELFCVERSAKSPFMPGALVFPGGKLSTSDADAAFHARVVAPRAPHATHAPFAEGAEHLRALTITALRETLEEAALLLATPTPDDAAAEAMRTQLLAAPDAFAHLLAAAELTLDLSALVPFARWITPRAEARRFDTRFFVARAPAGQSGAVDAHETVSSFWASPAETLRRFDAGAVVLFAPTHRTLELLAPCASVDEVFTLAEAQSLEPICPELVRHTDASGEAMALVLPGDPEHSAADVRVAGPSRFVQRSGRWLPGSAPR